MSRYSWGTGIYGTAEDLDRDMDAASYRWPDPAADDARRAIACDIRDAQRDAEDHAGHPYVHQGRLIGERPAAGEL